MNTGEIINSGILMDYCLGLLTAAEKEKVEQLRAEHPEIAAELQLLQNSLEHYAVKKTTWEKVGLRKKIWEAIDKINKDGKD